MLLVTLRYLATGFFLQVVADFVGIHKSSACRIVYKVCRAIAGLHSTFIKMPVTDDEAQMISTRFYTIARFPRCIGAIDCTHIKISSPGGNQPEIFRNRKNFFSFNVQAICDADLKLQNIVCRWPGSSHDSFIFNNSNIRAKFERGEYRNYILIGDSGYGIRPFLITPLANPITAAENLFNESQIRTRNPIERCFGVWKRRFPILALGIRLKVEKVEAVVIATGVLHNIACMFNEEIPVVNPQEEAAIQFVNEVDNEIVRDSGLVVNNSVRYQLINDYFNRLQ
ncbi:unnamed protein product [Callosobruchus maculatus]|uniref:DDE Tnp4 domain-containing protein n=1 Tax=Callosobruchus maculatus TaxID=64391 RepID=A0A653BPQ9_CALMS|nr:unnamed protein product [Callosobruchus maculatus]